MTIWDSLPKYAGAWTVKSSRSFTKEEIDAVYKAVVVSSAFGMSVCFFLKAGGQTYIPLTRNSTKSIGEELDLSKAELVTLEKSGESDIIRVEV